MEIEEILKFATPRRKSLQNTASISTAASVIAALLLTVSFGSGTRAEQQVRIAGVEYRGDLPTMVADRRGLFAERQLQPRVRYSHSGERNLELLRGGDTDFALMALTPLVLDHIQDTSHGQAGDPVILASLVHSTRFNQVVALADDGIREPADLRGRRVALDRGTKSEFVWWLFADFHGLDPRAVQRVDRTITAIPGTLAAGKASAAVVWEPWTARLERRHGEALRQFAGSNLYTAKWVLVTTRGYAVAHGAACRGVLAAYEAAIDFIEHNPGEASAMYASLADLPPDKVRDRWAAIGYELGLDWSLIATLQQQLQWAVRAGHAEAGASGGSFSLLEPGPLASVQPSAVRVPRSSSSRVPPR